MNELAQKRCLPCEGIGSVMASADVVVQLADLPGWTLGGNSKCIVKEYVLKSFVEAVDFINKIKDIAEDQMHHPDLHLTNYKHLRIVLYTHALNGVTENDLIVAAKINEVSLHV